MNTETQINHTEYPKRLKHLSTAALWYIIKDASEAIRVNPAGHKAGFYADEISYASMELKKRAEYYNKPPRTS